MSLRIRMRLLSIAALSCCACAAHAAGFGVNAQSASAAGYANAGAAALAEDASTIWYNPAGLVRAASLHPAEAWQLTLAVNLFDTTQRFHDSQSSAALGQALGSEGGDAGRLGFVPAIFLSRAINPDLHVGIGINTPFGLTTEYDGDWMGRFQATRSSASTFNLNAAFAYRLQHGLSVGGGVNAAQMTAELSNRVNYTAAILQAGLASGAIAPAQIPLLLNPASPISLFGLEGNARLKGDDQGYGWNVGFLYEPAPSTRLGAHYRSAIKFVVAGDVTFTPPDTSNVLAATIAGVLGSPGMPLSNGPAHAAIKLPAIAGFSAVQRISDRSELLLDATWEQWSTIQNVRFLRADGTVLSELDWGWRDTWRYAIGANYRARDDVLLKLGVHYDQTPIRDDSHRGARLPDNDRAVIAAGLQLGMPSHTAFWTSARWDFAASYTHVSTARLVAHSEGSPAASGVLDGSYTSRVLGFNIQLTANF